MIRYDVPGTAAHGNIILPANREILVFTDAPGTARFFTADDLIAAVPNSPKRCTVEP